MRPLLPALLLLGLPGLCQARTPKAAAPMVSSPTASALPLLAPTTAPLTLPLIFERFEDIDRGLKSLSADFRQFVRWDDSGLTQALEGSVEYRKPDLLRLEHRLPEAQTIVSDGLWLWMWRRATNQVIQTRLEDWRKSEPLAQGIMDFGNYAGLLRSYEVALASSSPLPDGHRRVELLLTPRGKDKKSDFALRLRLSTRDFFPADAELRVGQVLIHSLLEKVRLNPEIPEGRFRFSPPEGADVFQNLR